MINCMKFILDFIDNNPTCYLALWIIFICILSILISSNNSNSSFSY